MKIEEVEEIAQKLDSLAKNDPENAEELKKMLKDLRK